MQMMIRTVIFSLLVAAPLAVPAAAAPKDTAVARNAVDVRSLETFTSVAPRDGGAFIELAQAYMRDNRPAEAATAYRRALNLDNVMMQSPTGDSIWSHQVARRSLSRVAEFTSR
jgi:cytochrome c-type biogenesis protein CcmH/NrfG